MARLAAAVPPVVHEHVVIVGSLAAAYHLMGPGAGHTVRTKDIDCVLVPHVSAVECGRRIATVLLGAGWLPQRQGRFGAPGTAATPVERLPVVRLFPPGDPEWFLELLGDPEGEEQAERRWERIEVPGVGHYGLPSFPFMGVATFEAPAIDCGLRCAQPSTMALAHLLEHRDFRDDAIAETEWLGRPQRRRNKDLGRVLAIGALSSGTALEAWPDTWLRGLCERFPSRWPALARTAGEGLRRLLASEEDMAEAVHHANGGLCRGNPRDAVALRAVGERIMGFAVAPLAASAPRPAQGA
jgi:hypothetical protein